MSESRHFPLSPDEEHGKTVFSPSNCLRSFMFSLNRMLRSPKIPLASSFLIIRLSQEGSGGTTSTISRSIISERSGACTNVTCLSSPVKMTVFTSALQSSEAFSIRSRLSLIFNNASYLSTCFPEAKSSIFVTFLNSSSPVCSTRYTEYSLSISVSCSTMIYRLRKYTGSSSASSGCIPVTPTYLYSSCNIITTSIFSPSWICGGLQVLHH